MSTKSTGRTGNEGDRSSTYTNACSESSSPRSRKDIEGGPSGDAVPGKSENVFKDYLILMLQDNEDQTDCSDCSEDKELYDLRNNYIEKLNIVRKRLNLIELSDNEGLYHQSGCQITEIIDELPQEIGNAGHNQIVALSEEIQEEEEYSKSQTSDEPEITTIHPFSLCYKTESKSLTNILDLEYNPPKKKSCFRLKTPKLPSASESNIPYHTKVSLHEDLFKESKGNDQTLLTDYLEQFTSCKEIQCSELDIDHAFMLNPRETEVGNAEIENITLFPEVVINSKKIELIDRATSPSSSIERLQTLGDNAGKMCFTNKGFPLYLVEDSSGGSYNTASTSTTAIGSPTDIKPTTKKRFSNRNRIHPIDRLTKWSELGVTNYQGTGDIKRRSVTQYVTYRKGPERIKSSPIKSKRKVPFGPILIGDFKKPQTLENKFYLFNSSSQSDEDKVIKEYYGRLDSDRTSDEIRSRSFWKRLTSCFTPLFNLISRN